MSPFAVRRYRAERLLRREFDALRGRVLVGVRARLRAAGVGLDPADLEACYSQAWHGLYTTMLEGEVEVANPEGWLALVTYRRAIDEHRSRVRTRTYAAYTVARTAGERAPDADASEPTFDPRAPERDLAGELDDRTRLRQLMEGLRGRLSPRERQAAALCYLQGRSRADAAARMGISEARMRKLMDGRPGSPGVATKVGELLESIRAGSYCSEQSSLMRGFAFGILDPDGERYAIAMAHQRECPACRVHVLALRGLAAVLPPLPLPIVLGAGVVAGAGVGGAGAGAGGVGGAGAGVGGAGVGGAAGVGAGTGTSVGPGVGATGATGVAGGAAGGGWLLAGGGIAGKLAVGCLVAVGVGASCVALSIAPFAPHRPAHRRRVDRAMSSHGGFRAVNAASGSIVPLPAAASVPAAPTAAASVAKAPHAFTTAVKASREFGPEQPGRRLVASTPASSAHPAHAATDSSTAPSGAASPSRATSSSRASAAATALADTPGTRAPSSAHEEGAPSAAAREFGPG